MLSRLARVPKPTLLKVAQGPSRPGYVAVIRGKSTVANTNKEEEKKPLSPSFAEKYHLNDWRIAVPVGLFVGIPALRNDIYVLNEESQLAVCFLLFVGAGYKFLHKQLDAFIQEKRAEELRAVNEAEDYHIQRLEEAIEQYKSIGAFEKDVIVINEDMKAFVEDCATLVNNKSKHLLRDYFVQRMDTVIQLETRTARAREAAMIREGTKRTMETFLRAKSEGSSLSDDYFKQALAVLENPESEIEDPVAEVFTKHCVQYLEDFDKKFSGDIQLDPETRKRLQEKSDANMKRWNYAGQRVIIPETWNVNRVPWELFKP